MSLKPLPLRCKFLSQGCTPGVINYIVDLSYIGWNLVAVKILSDRFITLHLTDIVYVIGTGTWILHCAEKWKVGCFVTTVWRLLIE